MSLSVSGMIIYRDFLIDRVLVVYSDHILMVGQNVLLGFNNL